MRKRTPRLLLLVLAFLLGLPACSNGGEGDACFEDSNCRGSLECCNATSTTRGTCEEVCEELPVGDAGTDASVDGGDAGDAGDADVSDADLDADVSDADLDADLDASEEPDATL